MSHDKPPASDGASVTIDFGKLAAEVMVEHFHEDVKVRLDAQGADAFELAAAEVESHGEFLLVASPTMGGRQMMMRLASRLRGVAKSLRG